MDRDVPPPLPLPLIASIITLFVGVFACAVALVIEEEQREIEQSLLRDSLYMLWDSRKRKSDNAEDILSRNADIYNGIGIEHSNASWKIT